jgi:aldehyde dehydrogenase (NAD+)/aldehyde dehydrogenase
MLMELIGDILPAGVLNIVTGFGAEAGQALATSKRIAKLSFTGSTETGRKVYHNAAENIIPVTMELGGKSPNIFFPSVAAQDDKFFSKAVEGALMFALNQGEICTTPSRILVHEDIADLFIERMQERLKLIKKGNPLDPETMIGSQVSKAQCEKILNYINIGKEEGAVVLAGGEAGNYEGDLAGGYYVQPTVLKGTNNMRVFQEEIFGPVVALTTFSSTEEAIAIANDTPYGLGAGVWSRDAHELFQVPRAIQAGRVWVNQYNTYPAHAPFGGVKESGFGRENHKMALDHYRVVKNMLISYDKEPVGFF